MYQILVKLDFDCHLISSIRKVTNHGNGMMSGVSTKMGRIEARLNAMSGS